MPAIISNVSGRDECFVAGEPAWHGLGIRVDETQTAESAIKLAGLDWAVEQRPLALPCGTQIHDQVANVRQAADGSDFYLGTVGKKYRIIQNHHAFSFMDELVGAGEAVFETAGALFDGKRIWVLATIPGDIVVGEKDDRIKKHLLLCNGHDGSMTCRVFWTPVRVVCNNTLTMALRGRRAEDGIAIRHSGNIDAKLDEARMVLAKANEHYAALGMRFTAMRDYAMSRQDVISYHKGLVPDPPADASKRMRNTAERKQNELWDAFEAEREVAGDTLWGAYNSATRWADHSQFEHRPSVTAEGRMATVLFGGAKQFKQKAADVAMSLLN